MKPETLREYNERCGREERISDRIPGESPMQAAMDDEDEQLWERYDNGDLPGNPSDYGHS